MQCFHFYRKEEKMHAIFQTIAPRYNCLNRMISFFHDQYWRRKAVEQANFPPQAKLLDVCCGTGRLTQELLRHGGEESRITGLDFSANMLREAEANLRYHPQCRQVSWVHGNALHLPFADASFDGVSIAFGLYSVAGTEQVLQEMLRVLRPGGKLLLLELSQPADTALTPLFHFYFEHILPLAGSLYLGLPVTFQRWLPESLHTLPSGEAISQSLDQLGAATISGKNLTNGIVSIVTAVKSEV